MFMNAVQHDEACMLCGEDHDPPIRVCCDACVRVAHISCLDPPLKRAPEGSWLCPICRPVCNIEKFLDVRTRFKVRFPMSNIIRLLDCDFSGLGHAAGHACCTAWCEYGCLMHALLHHLHCSEAASCRISGSRNSSISKSSSSSRPVALSSVTKHQHQQQQVSCLEQNHEA